MKKWIGYLLMITLLVGCAKQEEKEVLNVLAAASLEEPLIEMKTDFEQAYDVEVQFQFGGSGTLAQQISQGAPADVYIAADEKWVTDLAEKNLIQSASSQTVAENKLVLIGKEEGARAIEDLTDLAVEKHGEIAIGHPDTVPAGNYAKQTLQALGTWQALEEHLIYTSDVRQALAYVETGNVTYGFVYETDARLSEKVAILLEVPHHLHDPIRYPATIVADTNKEEVAKAWLEFLSSEKAKTIMESYHFSMN